MQGLGWQALVVQRPDGSNEGHTVPENDIGAHLLAGGMCSRKPRPDDEVADVWLHNAFDQRDSYENGRKLH